jgi:AcrR family transcriptional regulator
MMSHVALRSDARANRQRLIDAAYDVFRERGLDAEMKLIAERAGVGMGTIYRNFPNKEDLVAAIGTRMVDEVTLALAQVHAIEDPREALRAFLNDGLDIIDRYGDIAMAAMHQGLPPACQQLFAKFDKGSFIAEILRRGVASGCFRTDLDIPAVAIAVESMLNPTQYKHLRKTHSHEQIVDAFSDLFLHGLLAS